MSLAFFAIMQAPPANAQKSETPFRDVVDLGTVIARIKGLDTVHAEVAGRISLAVFFAETDGNQNIGNARSNSYKGSFQTGVSEDKMVRRDGRQSRSPSQSSIPNLTLATTRKQRGSAIQISDTIAGLP